MADGKAGFTADFNQLAKRYGPTDKRIEFFRSIAEADMVTVHGKHTLVGWHGTCRGRNTARGRDRGSTSRSAARDDQTFPANPH